MQLVILIRCQNGIVAWGQKFSAARKYQWVCGRDNFAIDMPADLKDSEQVLASIGQHSTLLAGTILQVTELTI